MSCSVGKKSIFGEKQFIDYISAFGCIYGAVPRSHLRSKLATLCVKAFRGNVTSFLWSEVGFDLEIFVRASFNHLSWLFNRSSARCVTSLADLTTPAASAWSRSKALLSSCRALLMATVTRTASKRWSTKCRKSIWSRSKWRRSELQQKTRDVQD